MKKTFRELYLADEIDFEEIDEYSYQWGLHDDDPRTLREYLGLTEEEEDVWISEGEEALKALLDSEKES